MFAYVKYRAKCPRHTEKKIVPVSEIRNFDSQNIANRNKSYNIKCGESYCAAIILFTGETEKALTEKITAGKRLIMPPRNLIESASDPDIPASGAKQQAARKKSAEEQVKKLLDEKLKLLENKTSRKPVGITPTGSNKPTNVNRSNQPVLILKDRTNNVEEERYTLKRKNPGLSSNEKGSDRSGTDSADKLEMSISAPKKAKPNPSDKKGTVNSRTASPQGKSSAPKIMSGKTSGVTPKIPPDKKDTANSQRAGPGKSSAPKITSGKTGGSSTTNVLDKKGNGNSRTAGPAKSSTPKIASGKSSGVTPGSPPDKKDTGNAQSAGPGKISAPKITNGKTSGVTLTNSSGQKHTENPCKMDPGKGSTSSRNRSTDRPTLTQGKGDTGHLRSAGLGKTSSSNTTNGRTSDSAAKPESKDAKCEKLTNEIRYLKAKCSKYEDRITEQNVMMKDLTQLNMELQRDIIEYFGEFKAMAKQYEGAIRNLEGADTPPPGFIQKSSNKIHLGRNIWIDKSKYLDVVSRAKTFQLFVKGMAVAVFGFQVLETCTVSGTRSNKYKDRPAKPKLDETKVLAIYDIFQHWLRTEKNLSVYEAHVEASKTRLYIGRKISDLVRTLENEKKSSAKVMKEADDPMETDNEADDPTEDDNEADNPKEDNEVDDSIENYNKVDDREELHDRGDNSNQVDSEAEHGETDDARSVQEDYEKEDDSAKQNDSVVNVLEKSDSLLDQEVDDEPEIESDEPLREEENSEKESPPDGEPAESEPDEAKEEHGQIPNLFAGTEKGEGEITETEEIDEREEDE